MTSKSAVYNPREKKQSSVKFHVMTALVNPGLEYFYKILQHLNIISTLRQCLSPRQTSFKISRSSFENFKLNGALRKKRLDCSLEKNYTDFKLFLFQTRKMGTIFYSTSTKS